MRSLDEHENGHSPAQKREGGVGGFIWSAPLAWMMALGYLLTMSIPDQAEPWMFPHIDKVVHVVFFAVLAWLWLLPLRVRLRIRPWPSAAIAFLLAVLYGVFTETVQSLLPHRHGNGWDVIANTLGASSVWLSPWMIRWFCENRRAGCFDCIFVAMSYIHRVSNIGKPARESWIYVKNRWSIKRY